MQAPLPVGACCAWRQRGCQMHEECSEAHLQLGLPGTVNYVCCSTIVTMASRPHAHRVICQREVDVPFETGVQVVDAAVVLLSSLLQGCAAG